MKSQLPMLLSNYVRTLHCFQMVLHLDQTLRSQGSILWI